MVLVLIPTKTDPRGNFVEHHQRLLFEAPSRYHPERKSWLATLAATGNPPFQDEIRIGSRENSLERPHISLENQ
jgi:hypothetical protein